MPANQQALLDGVSLRPIRPDERQRFDQLLIQVHHSHNASLVGGQLRCVAEFQGQWVALLAWSAAAFNLKDREAWIGWRRRQKRRRLPLAVNNSRFLILRETAVPNPASRVMKLSLRRLSRDWRNACGHVVLLAESFVDSQLFRGASCKASGWTLPGETAGYGRSRQDYHMAHERPKQLWVRELRPGVRTILRGRNLPAALQALEEGQVAECAASRFNAS